MKMFHILAFYVGQPNDLYAHLRFDTVDEAAAERRKLERLPEFRQVVGPIKRATRWQPDPRTIHIPYANIPLKMALELLHPILLRPTGR